jgi:hypothetical protein
MDEWINGLVDSWISGLCVVLARRPETRLFADMFIRGKVFTLLISNNLSVYISPYIF